MDKKSVCVLCATYNQAKYIGKALDSILCQRTNFPFEILVHDDASRDGTRDILKEYEKKYPQKIRLLLEDENQFSKGVDFWTKNINEIIKYKYICHCEGDDFWLDADKLQLQYDVLENNELCDMVACRTVMVAENGETEVGEIRPKNCDGILTVEETVLGGGMFLGTNSLFYRSRMMIERKKFEINRFLDYSLQIRGALRGGIYYIDRRMAAYRRYSDGSWTNALFDNSDRLKEQCETERNMLKLLDLETDGKYHATILKRLGDYEISFFEQLCEHRKDITDMVDNFGNCKIFLWGMGRRGNAFEKFLNAEKIEIEGVCDITNQNIGEKTVYGNLIFDIEDAENIADVIMTSTTRAFDSLNKKDGNYTLIDLQKYMMRE